MIADQQANSLDRYPDLLPIRKERQPREKCESLLSGADRAPCRPHTMLATGPVLTT